MGTKIETGIQSPKYFQTGIDRTCSELAIFEKSPEGLSLNEITDIRFFENDPKNKDKDRDGNPITKVFSEKDRSDLQRIAWESYLEFDRLRQGL